jgi:hypothetical protein
MFCERNFIIGTHRLGNLKIFIFLFGRLELNVSKLEALYFSHVPSPFCSNYFSDGGLILLPGLASDRGPTWDPSWDYRCVPPYLAHPARGPEPARQALYHLSHAPAPFALIIFK